MESRSAKRERYSDIRNMIVNDSYNLNITSADFNTDLQTAREDFALMFESMVDRQLELFSHSLRIGENYGEILEILKSGKYTKVDETSTQNIDLPSSYSDNIHRFVADASISLDNHAKLFKEEMEGMMFDFQNYVDMWNKKLSDLIVQSDEIGEERTNLAAKIYEFQREV